MVPSEQDLLKRRLRSLRVLPSLVIPAAAVLCMLVACSKEEKHYVPNAVDGDHTPTMATTEVSTLISDSGYTRYHLTAPAWLMFEDAEEPFWRFPQGLELQQYDTRMQPEANVVCDSAIYFSRKRLWRLDGNVVMVNTQADSFLTQQLFWDQNDKKIYTDSFIHIVRTDRTIEGYGMESDQSMLYYTVNRPTAILPAQRMMQRGDTATASADTIARPATAPRASSAPQPRPDAQAAPTAVAVKAADAPASAPENITKKRIKRTINQ